MNDNEKFIDKKFTLFLPSKNIEDVSFGSEYDSEKWRVRRNKNINLDLLFNESKSS